MKRSWTVPAVVEEWIDGDTAHPILDLGWNIYLKARCRILGINAPERGTEAGRDARDYALAICPEGSLVTFHSRSLDKYGRPLGSITDGTGSDFATHMISAGKAVPMKE